MNFLEKLIALKDYDLKNIDLSKIDLNKIDMVKLLQWVKGHHKTLIKVVLIAVTLSMLWGMFNNCRIKGGALQKQISQAKAKVEVIKSRDEINQDFQAFKSTLPQKLSELELIKLISGYAKEQHITITSMSPAERKDMGVFDVININFEAVSDNFKTMMLFLRRLEKSHSPLRVDSWSGQESDNGTMVFKIQASGVDIHP